MIISWDTETYLIRPGLAAPRMVCLSYDDGSGGKVVLAREGLRLFRSWITDPGVTLVGQSVVFDLGVVCAMEPDILPLVFAAIDEGRIRCTKIREMILANAIGELKFEWDPELKEMKRSSFSLERMSWKYLNRTMKKGEDSWRLRYAELEDVPVAQWPKEAVDYAVQDAVDTREIFLLQGGDIHGETGQMQAAWALNLMRVWGCRTDPAAVAKLRAEVERDLSIATEEAVSHGLIRPNGTRDMTAIRGRVKSWYEAHGRRVPLSDSGKNICTDRDALRDTDDPGLLAVSNVVRLEKLLSTYIVHNPARPHSGILELGSRQPVTPDYNVMVESYRTSCARPNIQNLPR